VSRPRKIVYCRCKYSNVVPEEVKDAVLAGLGASGAEFETTADLCEMAASREPRLKQWCDEFDLQVAACFPRAVKGLFQAGGATVDDEYFHVANMRTDAAEVVLAATLDGEASAARTTDTENGTTKQLAQELDDAPGEWTPWFPVIDQARCTHCRQCLSFCLFDVYTVENDRLVVKNPTNCKTDCPACARVCPEAAIIFPKYLAAPINGAEVTAENANKEPVRADLKTMLEGDLLGTLRQRSETTKKRFSKERDKERAIEERCACMQQLVDLGLPKNVEQLVTLDQLGGLAPSRDTEEPKDRAERRV
jgi:NAD-dependent dihydropyrimidine dehydrogenase PreA subunit